MRPLCPHCQVRPASRRAGFKCCWYCHKHFLSDESKLGRLPPHHPFRKAREAKIERMMERAARGLPLFEADT